MARSCLALLTLASCVAVVVPAGAAASPAGRSAPRYEFTIIFDTDERGFEANAGCPALNDQGVVAYSRQRLDGTEHVVRSTGSGDTVIARTGQRGITDLGRLSINDAGQVAFTAEVVEDEYAVFRGDADKLERVAQTKGTSLAEIYRGPAIGPSGIVAFGAITDDGDEGLFTSTGLDKVKPRFLASEHGVTGLWHSVAMNGRQIAFSGFDDGEDGVYRSERPGAPIPLADETGSGGIYTEPSITTRGRVAVTTQVGVGDHRILVGRDSLDDTYATSGDRFTSIGPPSLNRSGTVAYTAEVGDGEDGLYVGRSSRPIIEPGDTLDGAEVVTVTMCEEGLNAHGQVAFIAQVNPGIRFLTVRADPLTRDRA